MITACNIVLWCDGLSKYKRSIRFWAHTKHIYTTTTNVCIQKIHSIIDWKCQTMRFETIETGVNKKNKNNAHQMNWMAISGIDFGYGLLPQNRDRSTLTALFTGVKHWKMRRIDGCCGASVSNVFYCEWSAMGKYDPDCIAHFFFVSSAGPQRFKEKETVSNHMISIEYKRMNNAIMWNIFDKKRKKTNEWTKCFVL